MHEYFENVKAEALKTLRLLTGQDVEDSFDDVRKAVWWCKCHLGRMQACYAKEAAWDYRWARHEIAAHEAERKMTPATATK